MPVNTDALQLHVGPDTRQHDRVMAEPDFHFVAHLDMLGMSELTVRAPVLAWACLSRLVEAREQILNLEMELLPSNRRVLLRDHVHSVTFSDTMVLFTKSDEEDDLRSILVLFTELYSQLLHHSVPFRGGLAHGQFRFNLDHSIFSGPALVESYRLGESAQWLGLVVDKVVAERTRVYDLQAGSRAPVIVEWDVPVRPARALCGLRKKNRVVRQFVVNWPAVFGRNFTVPPPIPVECFYQAFEQLFGPFEKLPQKEQAKYRNTVAFVNARLSGAPA